MMSEHHYAFIHIAIVSNLFQLNSCKCTIAGSYKVVYCEIEWVVGADNLEPHLPAMFVKNSSVETTKSPITFAIMYKAIQEHYNLNQK